MSSRHLPSGAHALHVCKLSLRAKLFKIRCRTHARGNGAALGGGSRNPNKMIYAANRFWALYCMLPFPGGSHGRYSREGLPRFNEPGRPSLRIPPSNRLLRRRPRARTFFTQDTDIVTPPCPPSALFASTPSLRSSAPVYPSILSTLKFSSRISEHSRWRGSTRPSKLVRIL